MRCKHEYNTKYIGCKNLHCNKCEKCKSKRCTATIIITKALWATSRRADFHRKSGKRVIGFATAHPERL